MNKKALAILGIIGSLAIGGGIIAKSQLTNSAAENSVGPSGKVTKEQARAIALARVPGEVVDEEYEKEKGKMVFGFEIKEAGGSVKEVKIDEVSGAIVSVGNDDDDSDENGNDVEDDDAATMSKSPQGIRDIGAETSESDLMNEAKISRSEAEKTALRKAPGIVEDGELENENGILVFSFDIRNKKGTITEVQVDAKSGKIVSVEEEDAAKEAAEKSNDLKENRHKPRDEK
ncbi:MAG: PepSY domain-containing protein [Pyrinomonadaceae bacterium]|nr:PepSY domain-containing protein [Pyrinomonadaceae bacterium]